MCTCIPSLERWRCRNAEVDCSLLLHEHQIVECLGGFWRRTPVPFAPEAMDQVSLVEPVTGCLMWRPTRVAELKSILAPANIGEREPRRMNWRGRQLQVSVQDGPATVRTNNVVSGQASVNHIYRCSSKKRRKFPIIFFGRSGSRTAMCNSKRGQGVERTGVQGKMRNSGEIDLFKSFQSCVSIEVRVPATGRGAPEAPLVVSSLTSCRARP